MGTCASVYVGMILVKSNNVNPVLLLPEGSM